MKINDAFLTSMQEAFQLMQTKGPMEATEVIQRALRESQHGDIEGFAPMPAQVVLPLLPTVGRGWPAGMGAAAFRTDDVIDVDVADVTDLTDVADLTDAEVRPEADREADAGGHFLQRIFKSRDGQRAYKLYVPRQRAGELAPLVVMLHGCTQDADDFAAGTGMNALAELHGSFVVYPVQPANANPSKCWNWFNPADQESGRGEPALIAGITREVMAAHRIDPDRVYIAGLSAGGAMAAVMIEHYPDLYAAAGVHSGLPSGSAHDLPSALGAMRGGAGMGLSKRKLAATPAQARRPIIVIHGDADHTVHASNGDRLFAPFEAAGGATRSERGDQAGRIYTRKRITTPDGVDAEHWIIHGASHAWAGGSSRGSYTDPQGPDASAAMMRFFLAHPQRKQAA